LGGEEFLIVFSGVSEHSLYSMADRIRTMIELSGVKHGKEELHVTVSIGVTALRRMTHSQLFWSVQIYCYIKAKKKEEIASHAIVMEMAVTPRIEDESLMSTNGDYHEKRNVEIYKRRQIRRICRRKNNTG
jgi:GGDEF domain-containing protein